MLTLNFQPSCYKVNRDVRLINMRLIKQLQIYQKGILPKKSHEIRSLGSEVGVTVKFAETFPVVQDSTYLEITPSVMKWCVIYDKRRNQLATQEKVMAWKFQ